MAVSKKQKLGKKREISEKNPNSKKVIKKIGGKLPLY